MAAHREGHPTCRSVGLYSAILLAVVSLRATSCNQSAADESAEAFKSVLAACTNKLDLKSIREFKSFARHLRQLNPDSYKAKEPTAISKKEREAFRWCLEGREALLELEQMIDDYDRLRPCKRDQIDRLEGFARRHLLGSSKSAAMRFFTLFGVNIGINCKLNLLAHLRQADLEVEPLDFIYSMASPTGWSVLINEQTRKSMKFGGSSHASNQIVHKIARLIPGLSQVEQLEYLNFDHAMDDRATRDRILVGGREPGEYQLQDAARFGPKTLESLRQIIKSCQNLDQFYVNSILSLARLNELGLLVGYLNEFHEPSLSQHKWLAAASFCQLMARVRLLDESGEQQQHPQVIKFEILHADQLLESRRQLYSYVAPFDEIGDQARELAWRASVSGGQWKQRSAAMFRADQAQSTAMRQVKQYFKGVEQNFKLQRDEQEEAAAVAR